MSRATMKEAMKGYKRISRPEEINPDAALNLARAVLVEAHDDYINALVEIHRLNKIKKKRELTSLEKKTLKESKADKKECEEFYVSRTFQIYTLNSGINGKIVIEKLKAEAKEIYK